MKLLRSIATVYQKHYAELAKTISQEMGAPFWLSNAAQAATGIGHLNEAIKVLESYAFEELRGTTMIRREPIGVCGLITPWNWPVNQIMCKVAPALAAGCTVVLKPTEVAPLNAILLAEIFHEAGVPAGVFNLVNGDGPTVGQAIASHPGVDMVSFTGSTRAGILVAKAAADTVKRVTQELGGKSANVILDDADLGTAVGGGMMGCALNSGQSCNAPTRMLVPTQLHDQAVAIAKGVAEGLTVGPAFGEGTRIGPVVSDVQWQKIQRLIQKGIDEGATLVTGGLGRPAGLERGYFVRPTVFANVRNDMTIAREEIFGPGALDPALQQRGRGDPDRQRHAVRPRRLRVVEEPRAGAARGHSPARGPGQRQRRTARLRRRPSAATSSRATVASGASSASRSSSR